MPRVERRTLSVAAVLVIVQGLLFYDHFAVALTLLFGMGIGVWLRHWTAAFWALAVFFASFILAVATGWLHDARPFAEPLLGGALAVLGGLIGGGIFQLLREDQPLRGSRASAEDEPLLEDKRLRDERALLEARTSSRKRWDGEPKPGIQEG